ncbi:hypothetical protein [Halorubellus litoreus]|uniref:Uncharacterized protein n=1 Tax=Halorubellus litoreus TaxID=755308 RepID=A0ABD5VM59_9EURY
MDDVVPVAVAYIVSAGTTTRVPADTHLLQWCPAVSLPSRDASAAAPDTERPALHPGLTALDGTLRVDGNAVGATSDVIRPESGPALAFWNITDPLPEGTHEAAFSITMPEESPHGTPARIGIAGELAYDWEPGKTISVPRTIIAAPPADVPTRRDTDPLWGRRDVQYVTGGPTDMDDGIETVTLDEPP